MSKPKLHEILAVESDREAAANAVLAETINTLAKKPDHFQGRHAVYTPFAESAMDAEETSKELVDTVQGKLTHALTVLGRALDVTITKDVTNQTATSAIVVDGEAITPLLPATALLGIETRLKKWMEMFRAIPTLAPGRSWELDPSKGKGVYLDSNPESRFRTKKSMQHKVLYDATPEHPAQIEKWSEDERIGKVTETIWCSMITPARKSEIIANVSNLIAATKQARQRANCAEVEQVSISNALVTAIFK